MKLTDLFLRNLQLDGSKKRYFDDAIPNFGVRVYKSGVSFIVLQGSTRKSTTIGKYPALSLKNARTKAIAILQPLAPKNATIEPLEALRAFLFHCSVKNKPRTVKDYTRLLKRFPDSWDKQTILTTLQAFRSTPGELSHLTTAFQVFLNWCVHNGYIEQNPIAGLRNQGKINKRDRVLSEKELKAIWNSLSEDRFSTIVKLLIITGQRKGELVHISISDNIATIPAEYTKNGLLHTFPVDMALPYLPAPTFNGWTKAKARLDESSGVTGWTLHDLRRTFASTHARLGTPIHVVEKMLNHISGTFSGVAGIYNRYSYLTEMTEALAVYENHLNSLIQTDTV